MGGRPGPADYTRRAAGVLRAPPGGRELSRDCPGHGLVAGMRALLVSTAAAPAGLLQPAPASAAPAAAALPRVGALRPAAAAPGASRLGAGPAALSPGQTAGAAGSGPAQRGDH